MAKTLTLALTKKQWELLAAFRNDLFSEILFGGGWSGGKTWGICEIVNMTCIAYPWIAWMIWRKEWEQLQKTTLLTLQTVMQKHGMKPWTHYDLNLQTKIIRYYNGSRIFFTPLKHQPSDPEFNFLGSYDLTFAFIDEAQEITRKVIDVIKTRFTEKIKEYNITPKIILGCNPMIGHLKSDFIIPSKNGTLKPDRCFIQSLYTDNPHIDHKKYEANYSNADRVTRERILNGNWDYDDRPNKLYDYDRIVDIFTNPISYGEKYIIGDVAGEGKDRAVIGVWNGFCIIDHKVFAKCSSDEFEGAIKEFSQRHGVPMSQTAVDMDGIGWAVAGHLKCIGFQNNSSPIDDRDELDREAMGGKPQFQNLKTQCYAELKKKIDQSLINTSNMEPWRDEIIQELDAVEQVGVDKEGVFRITPKEKIKEMIGRSPDFADMFAMRMYFEVCPKKQKSYLLI